MALANVLSRPTSQASLSKYSIIFRISSRPVPHVGIGPRIPSASNWRLVIPPMLLTSTCSTRCPPHRRTYVHKLIITNSYTNVYVYHNIYNTRQQNSLHICGAMFKVVLQQRGLPQSNKLTTYSISTFPLLR